MTATALGLCSPEPTDAEVVRLMQAGDNSRFSFIYHRYHPKLCGLLRSLTRDPVRAEELEQRTWVRFVDLVGKCDTRRDLLCWLRGIAIKEF